MENELRKIAEKKVKKAIKSMKYSNKKMIKQALSQRWGYKL